MRTWTRTDSTVNEKTLETYLNSVLSKIILKPGITLKSLVKEYLHILSPMHVRELVEVCIFFSISMYYNSYLIFFSNCKIDA